MTVTNGQDQSAEFQRESARRGLEPSRQQSLRALIELEGEPLLGPRPPSREVLPALSPRYSMLFEGPSAWNIGAQEKDVIEGRAHSPAFPMTPRKKPSGLTEGFNGVCERWSLDAVGMAKLLHLEEEPGLCDLILSGQVPPMTGDLKDRMALVIGISVGLGELFNDDKDAEIQWLTTERSELGGFSPMQHILKGDLLNIRDVVELMDDARGLR